MNLRRNLWTLLAVCTCVSAGYVTPVKAENRVVAFGLSDDISVFTSEANIIGSLLARKFSPTSRPIIRTNSPKGAGAKIGDIKRALSYAASQLTDHDKLIVYITSHGSRDGLYLKYGDKEYDLPPIVLKSLLSSSGARNIVLIVSACFSGIFKSLSDSHTIVLTASDASHPSFGCTDGEKLTYFGQVLKISIEETTSLTEALKATKEGVPIFERELCRNDKEQCYRSNPQLVGIK